MSIVNIIVMIVVVSVCFPFMSYLFGKFFAKAEEADTIIRKRIARQQVMPQEMKFDFNRGGITFMLFCSSIFVLSIPLMLYGMFTHPHQINGQMLLMLIFSVLILRFTTILFLQLISADPAVILSPAGITYGKLHFSWEKIAKVFVVYGRTPVLQFTLQNGVMQRTGLFRRRSFSILLITVKDSVTLLAATKRYFETATHRTTNIISE